MSTSAVRSSMFEVTRTQHGVISRRQLVELGLDRSVIRDRVSAGELERVAPSTYVLPGSPSSLWQRLLIAVLSRERAFVSGRMAAFVHGFDGVACPVQPEITVPPTASGRSPVARVRRSQHFTNIATVLVEGVPCSSVPETVFTMAQHVSTRRIGRFLDAAVIADPAATTELGEIYLRHQGERMKGMARLRPLLLERLSDEHVASESELESLADVVFADLDVPTIGRQVPIPWAPASGRVDRFIADWNLIVELDGRRWHSRSADFEKDRRRDNAAVANGYRVLRFTWQMLQSNPDRCRLQIVEAGEHAEYR